MKPHLNEVRNQALEEAVTAARKFLGPGPCFEEVATRIRKLKVPSHA